MVYLRDCAFLRAITSHQSDGLTHQVMVPGSSRRESYTISASQVRTSAAAAAAAAGEIMEHLCRAASNRVTV